MRTLRIRNWQKYQHYKDRRPPWIKLHFQMLSSRDWVLASNSERVLAIASMLIASQSDNEMGEFLADPDYFQRVAYLNDPPDFNPLIRMGFLEVVDEDASACKRMLANACSETETETEKETEIRTVNFGMDTPDLFPVQPKPTPKRERPAEAAGRPLSSLPLLDREYDRIQELLADAHRSTMPNLNPPKPGTDLDAKARQTLEQIVRLDGHSEEAVIETLNWLFTEEDQSGEFSWREQVKSLASLRKKSKSNGARKFDNIRSAFLKTKRKHQPREGHYAGDSSDVLNF